LADEGRESLLAGLQADIAEAADAPSPRKVADLFARAAILARDRGYRGLLLIVDELGKFLEYAALHPQDGDIFVLQELAEASARSDAAPLLVLCVLHQNAEAYAQRLGRTHRAEWAKIGERYKDIPFFPSDAERMDMVGRALQRKPELYLNGHLERLSRRWVELPIPHAGLKQRFVALAQDAYPLHPIALLALPALFRKSGQSHRSLFNFLSGEEPHALGRFLRETPFSQEAPPLYSLDSLFGYAAEVLVGGWTASGIARLWAEAIDTVERATGLSALAQRALKCMALLGILREPRLPASRQVLELALSGCDGAQPDVRAAISELEQRRLITYSRARSAYRLWEGGDVDVEAELASARATLPSGTALHVARRLCPPPHLIARRHSYQRGCLRTVTVRPCEASQVESALADAGHELTMLLCLAPTPEDSERAEERARSAVQPNVLTVVALESEVLRDAAADVAAADIVENSADGLQSDRAGRRELAARRSEAEAAFRSEWDRLFGPQNAGASWFHRGERVTVAGARDLSQLLSHVADASYPHAPCLRNELVNRQMLSSAAAAGRRTLVEAMLTRGTEERLGIQGFPPELSMYECLLRATGLHRPGDSGEWEFGPPPLHDPGQLRPTWSAIEGILFTDPPEPRQVLELFRTLSAPPYGLTQGVLPVLLCAFILAHPDETSLYREDTFIAEPGIADYEVLMRRPELFAVAGCRVSGDRAAIIARLAAGLGTAPAVLAVVRALLRMIKGLPEFAWKTRRLPAHVLSLREAVSRARSPERLLFHDIPAALGVTVFEGDEVCIENVGAFFDALNGALRVLSQAMPSAIAEARDALLDACGLPRGDAGWTVFRARCAEVQEQITHPTLLPLVRRAAMPGDDEAALDSVLALLANRSPRTWTDVDAERCVVQARTVGGLYQGALGALSPRLSQLSAEEREQRQRVIDGLRGHLPENVRLDIVCEALVALAEELRGKGAVGDE
jgi:hypothetical protein